MYTKVFCLFLKFYYVFLVQICGILGFNVLSNFETR